ncbi:hypothetical protein E2K64_23160, partial [Escherichia coli]
DDLLPDYVTDKTFYLLFILYPLLSLRNVIYASLKFDKTFYLLDGWKRWRFPPTGSTTCRPPFPAVCSSVCRLPATW